MKDNRPGLTLIPGLAVGCAPSERIALSLVHPMEHIDVPRRAIRRIEALEEFTYVDRQARKTWTFHSPCVELSFAQAIGARIWRLTQRIVDQPMELVVGGECVARPVVREPIGLQGSFQISAYDIAEAQALAHRLRAAWSMLRVVG
jgi:preprotein translocase subunit SecD